MKKWSLTILSILILLLTACGTTETKSAEKTSSVSADPPEAEPVSESTTPETKHAFGKVLWDAYQLGVLPDGSALDYAGMELAAENDFALFDVDGDGQEELLLYWTHACMAGMRADIFGYHNGTVYTELTVFPASAFYSNGVVIEDWSHNQGLAGDSLWPYSIYLYDAEDDTYNMAGAVDAWDRELVTEDFPTGIDVDDDGIVYFLLPGDEAWHYVNNRPDYTPVDGAEYEIWRNGFLHGAAKLEIHTQKLTEDNIAALGCPKPDVPLPEPAG